MGRLASADDDDLLTFLWEHDFSRLQYRYIDLAESSGSMEVIRGEQQERQQCDLLAERERRIRGLRHEQRGHGEVNVCPIQIK